MALLYARQGGEFFVNSTTANEQVKPESVGLTGGGFVVVWQDSSGLGGDASETSIKGQRYDSNGNPVGGEFLVNTTTASAQQSPTIVATANGGFFVAWADSSGTGGDTTASIKGQFFDPAGAKVGGEILINTDTAGNQVTPVATLLADGALAVSWGSPSLISNEPISYRTQIIETNGAKRGFETTVANGGLHAQAPQSITGLAGGGYAVAWEQNQYLYARVFDASGNAVGPAFKLSDSTFGGEQYVSLIGTPDGGFAATWAHWAFEQSNNVEARLFNAAGQPLGAAFVVTATTAGQQFAPDIAAVPGGYVITWQSGLNFFSTWDVRGQFYDTNFNRSGNEFAVNTVTPGHQEQSTIAVTADGGIAVAFQSPDASGTGIKAQVFKPSAAPTDIALSTNSVIETQIENIPFATISASGAVNSNFTYQYLGDSMGGAFRIEGDKLIVADSGRLDADIHGTITVWIQATDDNGHTYNEVITLNQQDVDEEARYSAGTVVNLNGEGSPEMARLTNGNYIVVSLVPGNTGGNTNGIQFDIFDANGNLALANIAVPGGGSRAEYAVAPLQVGGFVVTWTSTGASQEVYAQRFDGAGNAVGETILVNTTVSANQFYSAVAGVSGGGFVVAWTDASGTGGDPSHSIKAQIFDVNGNKVGSEFLVNTSVSGVQISPTITHLASGGFAVAWTDAGGLDGSGAHSEIRLQVFDAAGTKVGPERVVNTVTTGSQYSADIVALSDGGFVVTWEDASQSTPFSSQPDIRAQKFDSAGNPVGSEILVNTTTAAAQVAPVVEAVPGGGFIIAWQDIGTSFQGVTKFQSFDANGVRYGPEMALNTGAFGGQPGLVAFGTGSFAVSWVDETGLHERFVTLEHPVVAANDSNTTAENGLAHGNVLANDFAQPVAELRVGAVQGQESNVGQTVLLPSGATVQVNANGNYTYNPNGAFNHLTGATGAANSSATDSFTYELTNGTFATVTITITGVGSSGDRPQGTAGNDVIVGTDASELFDLDQGGDDNVSGNGGNDGFYFGGTLTSADIVNGGAGIDTLILQGNYAGGVTIGTGVTGIEALSFFAGNNTGFGDPGTNLYDYVVTTSDVNFAAGLQVKVNAAPLLVGEDFTFNGSAETDATFLIYGGKGVDTLTGGSGSDIFFFADDNRLAPGDTINGGAGHDGLFLRGNYAIDFSTPGYSNLLTSIENITVTSITDERYARGGGTEFDYNIKFGDAQVPPGGVLTVSGALLQANETLVVDGSLETNGAFRIFGGAAADNLKGGAGNDFLEGGLTGDILAGGGGNDVFNYKSILETSGAAGADQIMDFATGDKIDLSAIDANTTVAGNQAFTFIGSNAFSGQAGELRTQGAGNLALVEGDVDGNGTIDFQILLTVADSHAITASDFVL